MTPLSSRVAIAPTAAEIMTAAMTIRRWRVAGVSSMMVAMIFSILFPVIKRARGAFGSLQA